MIGILRTLLNSTGGTTFTATDTGKWVAFHVGRITIEAFLSAAGGTATVEIHGSNYSNTTPSAATLLATVTLSGANDRATQSKPEAFYLYKCAKVTAIGGGAVVTVALGG